MSTRPHPWWTNAVVYQVYPRSFQDSDGDGVGDLPGIAARLPYLEELGVDAIWLSPFYPSSQVDSGYDVSDYCAVEPVFGTQEDFDELVALAHNLGLRLVVDLVPNHSSDCHPRFQAALSAGPGSPERDFYHFADGRGRHGDLPPNNWKSVFGGPSWTRVTEADGSPGQWYYHLFAPEQPDFNWSNPRVLEFFEGVLRFWLDRGVDGFRIDVSDALIKDTTWPDTEDGSPVIPKDQDSPVHGIYRRLREVMDEYPSVTSVLETGADEDTVALFLRPDEMHQAFNFQFLKCPWDAGPLAEAIADTVSAMGEVGAPPTWVVENHDTPRARTRLAGNGGLRGAYVPGVTDSDTAPGRLNSNAEVGLNRAKTMSLLSLALPGSAYVYAGQELGLPEVVDLPDEVRTDPVFFRTEGRSPGRDGCRVPLPWSGVNAPFGFSTTPKTWLPQPGNWAQLSVEAQDQDESSTLSFFRRLLHLRRTNPALGTGQITELSTVREARETGVLRITLSPRRPDDGPASADPPDASGQVVVVANLGSDSVQLPTGEILVSTGALDDGLLPPDSAAIVQLPAL